MSDALEWEFGTDVSGTDVAPEAGGGKTGGCVVCVGEDC